MISFTLSVPWELVCKLSRAITGPLPDSCAVIPDDCAVVHRVRYDQIQVEATHAMQKIALDEGITVLGYTQVDSRRFRWYDARTDESVEATPVIDGSWRILYSGGTHTEFYKAGAKLLVHCALIADANMVDPFSDQKRRDIIAILIELRDNALAAEAARSRLIELCRPVAC